jgi:integrase/recombinase XerC
MTASDCSAATCRSYAHDLLRWLRFLAAVEVPWERATRAEVRDLVRWFRVAPNAQRARRRDAAGRPPAGTLNPSTGKAYLSEGYAPRTINHVLSVVSAFYAFAVQAGLGPLQNPVPNARRGPGTGGPPGPRAQRAALRRCGAAAQKLPTRQPRDVGDELLRRLFTQLRHERDRALVAVALSAGVRAGELLSMTFGGIDAGRGVLSVIPKGGSVPQWVPAAPEAFVQVSRYLLTRPPGAVGDPLWLTLRRPARPLTYFALRQVLERINARLGSNISWHDLRHTFSHQLLADDALGLSDVQQLMRHRSVASLSVYSTTRVEELVQRLQVHHGRPAPPPPVAAGGYDHGDLQTLFPGFPLTQRNEQS